MAQVRNQICELSKKPNEIHATILIAFVQGRLGPGPSTFSNHITKCTKNQITRRRNRRLHHLDQYQKEKCENSLGLKLHAEMLLMYVERESSH